MEESRNRILLANSVYFSSLLDTFCWRGEVGSIFVVSIRMTKSSTTTISIDFGRWSPYKLSEAWPIHVWHMRKRCYYDNRCNPREVVIIKVNFLIRTICQIMLWWSGQNAKKSFDTLCYHHPNKILAKFQPQNPERIKQVGSRHRLHILMMFFMQSATTRKR